MTQLDTHSAAYGKIVAKAWSDPAFKAKLVADPANVLKAEGIQIPAGIAIKTVENTDAVAYFVLPSAPNGELSEETLSKVSGGTILPGPGGIPIPFTLCI